MDYNPKKENQHGIQYPPVGCSPKDNREVQGNDTGRSCIPHAEQYHLQQDTERNRHTMRFQDTAQHTCGKTYERHDRAVIQWSTD